MMRYIIKRKAESLFIYIMLIIVILWILSPLYFAVITSFKRQLDILSPSFIPFLQFKPILSHWKAQLDPRGVGQLITKGLINSLVVASGSSLLALTIGTFGAYSLARFRFKKWSNKNISTFILSQRLLPPIVLILPFLIMMQTLKLIDSHFGLILIHTMYNLPLVVLVMTDIFRELPYEIEEAALIDGCSRGQIVMRIAIPLSFPGLIAAGVLSFAFSWNEFIYALVLTYGKATTMPVIIAATGLAPAQGILLQSLSMNSIITLIPPLVLVMIVQKYIVRGLTFGAIK